MTFAVELLNITKEYPGVTAADDVSIFVEQGENSRTDRRERRRKINNNEHSVRSNKAG